MSFRINGVGIRAPFFVLAVGSILGITSVASAAGPDVRVSVSLGYHVPAPVVVQHVHHHHHGAGVLTIDGRRFEIDSSCSVQEQIHRAFERMGYDAWCVGRSVRVRTDCCDPEVCWRVGEYSMQFRERRSSITLTPILETCETHYGHHHRYHRDRHEGRYHVYAESVRAEVTGARGSDVSWTSVGVSTFIDQDDDSDDRSRRSPGTTRQDVHSGVRLNKPATIDSRTRIEDRASKPVATVRPPIVANQKRSTSDAAPRALPSDRVSTTTAKPAVKSPAKVESKSVPSTSKVTTPEKRKSQSRSSKW